MTKHGTAAGYVHGCRCPDCSEAQAIYYRQWKERDRVRFAELNRAKQARHRARHAGAKGTATAEALAARVAYYGGKCYLCGGPYEEMDHVIPIARGGSNWPANQRPACRACNIRKGAKRLPLVSA